jgi:hypothetical protein
MDDNLYNCLSCGHAASQTELGATGQTAKCPKCGRDMYRARTGSRYGQGPLVETLGGARALPAVPSRYGGGGTGSFQTFEDEDDDRNAAVLPHTPFIVILGLIFSFLPVICVGGLIISVMALNLVNSSPKGVRGKGLAIAGIVIGSLMTLLTIVLIASGPRP